jgi:hypothetical protein
MWNSRRVGEWIEAKSTNKVVSKKQRGWEYPKRLGRSPKVPRSHYAKANEPSERLSKKSPEEGGQAQGGPPDGEGAVVARGRAPFGLQGDHPQAWSPIGRRPPVDLHQRCQRTHPYAFARPKTGGFTGWSYLPSKPRRSRWPCFAREVGAGDRERILLVLDGAG